MKRIMITILTLVTTVSAVAFLVDEDLDLTFHAHSEGTYLNSTDVGATPLTVDEEWTFAYEIDHTDFDADRYFIIEDTLESESVTFNLEDGSMQDHFGNDIEFASIKAIRIVNRATTATFDLIVSGDWFTGTFNVSPNVPVHVGAGFFYETPRLSLNVIATSKDELTIDSGVNDVPYTLELIGLKQ